MNIYFDELYKYDRINEPLSIAIPFKKGECENPGSYGIFDNETQLPLVASTTARWEDGSVKWGFYRFEATLKRFTNTTLSFKKCDSAATFTNKLTTTFPTKETVLVDTGCASFLINSTLPSIFEKVVFMENVLTRENFSGPVLEDKNGSIYPYVPNALTVLENNPLVTKLMITGTHSKDADTAVTSETELTFFAGKSYIDIALRIINTTDDPLAIGELKFCMSFEGDDQADMYIVPPKKVDSTGCGDGIIPLDPQKGPVYNTMGTTYHKDFLAKLTGTGARVCHGNSNYRTEFFARNDNGGIYSLIDANYIIKEANEHYPEVFYGTFFADRTDDKFGICATIFQAQQNYPKAISASGSSINIYLVPKCDENVVMQSGMARTQKFMLHFHDKDMSLAQIDNRSIIYQMPDRGYIDASVYKDAGVSLDVFLDNKLPYVENNLISKGDNHIKAFGMLNFGDAPDPGYTKQGRGNGEPVWTNNEYDFPHACSLMYMRSGIRRFLDYVIVAANHWMDVDVCHYSKNPLHMGGQWEHTNGHCKNGQIVCSHEWVEGLLDYYHFTGDKRAYDTAIGIGHNVLRLLATPLFAQKGEINARETGWAMRTLVALYQETYDEMWLEKCDWIVGHFRDWEEEYGHWLSPYTDNTAIRVPFMISIAVGSLMRYYRIRPNEEIKGMMLRAIDDMVDNCILETGLFYYKQLPSINRLGNNTLVLEGMTIGYELTGDTKYLKAGIPTFRVSMTNNISPSVGVKTKVGDAVTTGSMGTKNFAQCFIPLTVFYKACVENGLGDSLM